MELITRLSSKASIRSQQGVVLIVALVFLISLTAVVSVLMLNTTSDIKMSGASQEKLTAVQEAVSAVDETISDQITGANNLFTIRNFPVAVGSVSSVAVNSINITNNNDNNVLADCPHTRLASSNQLLKCNILTITVTNDYGRQDTSQVNANAGIAQQLLNVGN